MFLSGIGKVANECWLKIPKHFPQAILDEFIIMPNHVHGIIQIDNAGNNVVPINHGKQNYPDHYHQLSAVLKSA